MDAKALAKQARKSISSYCYNECKAYCCRKGYLPMELKEYKALTGNKTYIDEPKWKELPNGRYSLDLNKGCPALKDFMCLIHKKRNRPNACQQFPLFLEKDIVKLSARCPAVKAGLFYPYIYKFKKMGFKIIEGNIQADSDFYKIIS